MANANMSEKMLEDLILLKETNPKAYQKRLTAIKEVFGDLVKIMKELI